MTAKRFCAVLAFRWKSSRIISRTFPPRAGDMGNGDVADTGNTARPGIGDSTTVALLDAITRRLAEHYAQVQAGLDRHLERIDVLERRSHESPCRVSQEHLDWHREQVEELKQSVGRKEARRWQVLTIFLAAGTGAIFALLGRLIG